MKGPFFIALACFLWAVDTLIRYPLLGSGISAATIVLAENLMLLALSLPILWSRRASFLGMSVSDLLSFLFIGVLGQALATLAFTRAFGLINPSVVILLQKLQPAVAVVLARVILKEPIKKAYVLWALVSFAGGLLISSEHFSGGAWESVVKTLSGEGNSGLGLGLTLLAVVGWGSSTVLGKRLSQRGLTEKEIMTGRFGIGLATMLVWAPVEPLVSMGGMNWLRVAGMVALSGIAGLWFYYHGLKNVPARLGTLLEMFFPFFAVLLNWGVLGVALSPLQLAGGALLLLGATVIQWKHY